MKTILLGNQPNTGARANRMIYSQSIEIAMSRIPPLWPLSRFVAVNPFVGLAKINFCEAAVLLHQNCGTVLAMDPRFYKDRYHSGLISVDDVKKAVNEVSTLSPSSLEATIADLIIALEMDSWKLPSVDASRLPSERLDAEHGTRWASFISDEISKLCSSYFDEGQALWMFPWKSMPLFSAWKESASLDCNPEISGISGWRKLVSHLPENPMEVIEDIVFTLRISEENATDVFHQLLLGVSGWAGHLQFLEHEKKLRGEEDASPNSLNALLAIRMVYELALYHAFAPFFSSSLNVVIKEKSEENSLSLSDITTDVASLHLIWQRAHECAMQRALFAKLTAAANIKERVKRKSNPPLIQAIFCIDVRSEIYRRSLEKLTPSLQTIGFAGFFGFPIEAIAAGEETGTPQCPVLMNPSARVVECTSRNNLQIIGLLKRVQSVWKSFKSSAVSSFIFVEIAGLGFLPKILKDLLHRPVHGLHSDFKFPLDVGAIPIENQMVMAQGALRHLGFAKRPFAKIVLICGHGSSTKNNPYRSSLDCGACGGHSGAVNARTAAIILNKPIIRSGLARKGILIPKETLFFAAIHNTTTDEVTLLDKELAPTSHQQEIALLQGYLSQASILARKERALSLGLDPLDRKVTQLIVNRSQDWSQVRPEWGLAGNYAFIAASRERTEGMDLDGRVFLNDYCYLADEGESTLELLLSAPVVVASWINLQYYASTVDNRRFGSGDKTLHNVTSMLGVLEGNGGDIRTGIPLQSVHDGKEWRHEPIRLHVCVEAPKEAIDRILKKQPSVAELVLNQWIHLFAMSYSSEEGLIFEKSNGLGGWMYQPIQ